MSMETAVLTKEQALVKEIHDAIDREADTLLHRPKELIFPSKAELEKKVERLQKLGFTGSSEVKQLENFDRDIQIQKGVYERDMRIYELARKYRSKYPFLKFITETKLNSICEKYGLAVKDVNKYVGSIPEKNLSEIEYWVNKIDPDDIEGDIFEYEITPRDKESEAIKARMDIASIGFLLSEIGRAMYIRNHTFTIESKEQLPESELIKKFEKQGVSKEEFMQASKSCKVIESNKHSLIAAPESMFKPDPPKHADPIVLQSVKGGYLILSKWGLEANDPELTVPELN
jgi:hypothetical protein